MAKRRTKEYNIEVSPFFNKNAKIRSSLVELSPTKGEDVVLAHKRYFKQDEYVKFIITDMLDIKQYHVISSLSKTLLTYIVYNCLEYNIPTFRLKASDIASILDLEESTIFKAIKELITIKYIARTSTKEVYWINHNKFYKGNYMVDRYLKTK